MLRHKRYDTVLGLFNLRSEDVDNATATVNKKLRGAFNLAIQRGYMAQNPIKGWRWDKPKKKEHRILTADEETMLIASADRLNGFKMVLFVRFVLETWARLSEATGLRWDDVDFENSSAMFRDTKSSEDRFVPFAGARTYPPTCNGSRCRRFGTAGRSRPTRTRGTPTESGSE